MFPTKLGHIHPPSACFKIPMIWASLKLLIFISNLLVHSAEKILLLNATNYRGITEAGTNTGDVCRKYGISDATFYKYKAKYGGMDISDARKLKALEDENAKLKKLLAEAMLDNAILKDVAAKKW